MHPSTNVLYSLILDHKIPYSEENKIFYSFGRDVVMHKTLWVHKLFQSCEEVGKKHDMFVITKFR